MWCLNYFFTGENVAEEENFFFSKLQAIRVYLVIVILLSYFNPVIIGIHEHLQITALAIGVTTWVSSLVVYVWSRFLHGTKFSITSDLTHDASLIRSGPYMYCRHPIYMSYILLWLSWSLVSDNALILFGGLLLIPFMAIRIRREERELREAFGEDYDEYARNTNRFFPGM